MNAIRVGDIDYSFMGGCLVVSGPGILKMFEDLPVYGGEGVTKAAETSEVKTEGDKIEIVGRGVEIGL